MDPNWVPKKSKQNTEIADLKNFSSKILIFEVFEVKVRHTIHYAFDNEAKNKT